MPTEVLDKLNSLREGIAEALRSDPRTLTMSALDRSIAEIGGLLATSGVIKAAQVPKPAPLHFTPEAVAAPSGPAQDGPSDGGTLDQIKALRHEIAETIRKDPRYLTLGALDRSIVEIGGVLGGVRPRNTVPAASSAGIATEAKGKPLGHSSKTSETPPTEEGGSGEDPEPSPAHEPVPFTAAVAKPPMIEPPVPVSKAPAIEPSAAPVSVFKDAVVEPPAASVPAIEPPATSVPMNKAPAVGQPPMADVLVEPPVFAENLHAETDTIALHDQISTEPLPEHDHFETAPLEPIEVESPLLAMQPTDVLEEKTATTHEPVAEAHDADAFEDEPIELVAHEAHAPDAVLEETDVVADASPEESSIDVHGADIPQSETPEPEPDHEPEVREAEPRPTELHLTEAHPETQAAPDAEPAAEWAEPVEVAQNGRGSGYAPMEARPGATQYSPSLSVKFGRLPNTVDLRPSMRPVADQNDIKSCVADAVTSALECWAGRALRQEQTLSRLFVYWNARWRDNMQDQDDGSAIQPAMEGLSKFGACPEQAWPFDSNLTTKRPGAEAYRDAFAQRVNDMAQVPLKLEAWKQALAEGKPIVFGIVLFSSFDECPERGGIVPMPPPEELAASAHGFHAMCAVGYCESEKVFIVRNCWGSDWCDHGYCYIPYAYVLNPKFNDGDCWVFTTKGMAQVPREAWSDATDPVTNGGNGVDFPVEVYKIADYGNVATDFFEAIRMPYNDIAPPDYTAYATSAGKGRWAEMETFDVATYLAVAGALTGSFEDELQS